MRALVVVAVLALASSSMAQLYPDPRLQFPGMDTIRSGGQSWGGTGAAARRVQAAIPTLSNAQLRQLAANAASFTRGVSVSVGSRAFLGTAVIAAAAIPAALTWFYEEAQRSAGTELDGWWNDQGAPPTIIWRVGKKFWDSGTQSSRVAYRICEGATGTCLSQSAPMGTPYLVHSVTGQANVDGFAALWDAASSAAAAQGWGSAAFEDAIIPGGADCFSVSMSPIGNTSYACAVGTGVVDLASFLDANPGAYDQLRDVVNQRWEGLAEDEADPAGTFAEPWPGAGVTFVPPLSWTVWSGSPFRDTTTDTDGDGWPDWLEWRLGTDPFNPNSRPVANSDPDGDGYTNAQERDAVTDPLDAADAPDPLDEAPLAEPSDPATTGDAAAIAQAIQTLEAQLAQLLAIVATSQLQREQLEQAYAELAVVEAQLAELQAIRALLEQDQQAPTLDPVAAPELDDPWTAMLAQVEAQLAALVATAETRLPFALEGMVPTPTVTGGSGCTAVQMPILGVQQDVGLCETPIHDFMAGPGRAVLLALAVVGFYLAAASLVAKS